MDLNQEITVRVNKWLTDNGIQKQKLQEILSISRPSLTAKLNNDSTWKNKEIEVLKQNKIIKITVR